MQFKQPKADAKYRWTNHVVRKMMHYGLSPDRVKRVIRNPTRAEVGVAEGTIAVMQPTGSPKKPTEIWVMYAEKKEKRLPAKDLRKIKTGFRSMIVGNQKVIITAWRYPAVSPVRDQIPIPADILAELKREGIL